ncbi:transglutaminase family protein [soil metagenome]
MITLTIHHTTVYRYNRPVRLGQHRLMLRPRESREVRLLSSAVTTVPPSTLSWAHDVFGNAVATAVFSDMVSELSVESHVVVQLSAAAWPVFDIAASAISYPFRYGDDEWSDLGALATPQYEDPDGRLAAWTRAFVRSTPTNTLALLGDLNVGVAAAIRYQSREEEGTQSPLQTLDRGWGSCRDLAVLFAEATRRLGFGARIISGYSYNADRQGGTSTPESTHAWAEVYVPGAGWITYDPTNRSVGGANLIPVAVARTIAQAMPVTGSFHGMTDAFDGMWVGVSVTASRAATNSG